MRTIETDIIEKVILIWEKIKKYWDNSIFTKNWITILQFNILWEILSKKWCTIKELKSNLIVSSASLSQTLDRMEKAEFIERSLGKEDKREIFLTATKKWETLYTQLNEKYISEAIEKFSNVPQNKKVEILRNLDMIEELI